MIRFILQNWWRRKERFILLIIGTLIIGVGLAFIVGLSETNKGTVVDELQQQWSASYDIVVRPDGARSITEEKNLLEPNYLSGLSGGISIETYEKIKAMPDVDVAAPIAMIGYANTPINIAETNLGETGIYRVTTEEVTNDGINEHTESDTYYFPFGDWDIVMENFPEHTSDYFLVWPEEYVSMLRTNLVAGIDPEQEAKLVGLDDAILDFEDSSYFTSDSTVEVTVNEELGFSEIKIPVIMSNKTFTNIKTNYTYELLDIPFTRETADETIEDIEEQGGESYLDSLKGEVVETYSFKDEEIFDMMINSYAGIDVKTGEIYSEDHLAYTELPFVFRPSPLRYKELQSPFSEKWPYAYELEVFHEKGDGPDSFRKPNAVEFDDDGALPSYTPYWVGFYDPGKLNISQDPATELPVETYRPSTAELVIDAGQSPINPPETLQPQESIFGFLANPPSMLTTIEAAEELNGDSPISAIRIKVAGVSEMSEESEGILQRVANKIEDETGLITDITLGSSPQRALTHVPATKDEEELGWFQQPWIKIGSSMTIFREAKVGFSGLILSVLAVAIIYVWASGLVSLLSRRKEFAVLLAVGWRPHQLSRLLFVESAILGIFVALIAWTVTGIIYISGDADVSLMRFLAAGVFGFIVYLLGAVIPAMLVRNISPYETMRTGEISKTSKRLMRTRGLLSMAFNHFIGKWRRSLLSIFAIALPTGLLALFLFITFRLKGIMYTTWLGNYVALEVGTLHYVATVAALAIAILTTAEIMWQNIAERKEEISLIKAVGWKNGSVRFLILIEGMLSGIFAAVLGLVLAFGMVWVLYGQFPSEEFLFILSTGVVPIIIGLIGAILPAEKAVNILPGEGINGELPVVKPLGKRMKRFILTSFMFVMAAFLYTVIQFLLKIS